MFFVSGIGGGPVSVPLVKSLRTPMHVAGGYSDRQGMALIVPATMVTASRGERLAHAVDVRKVRRRLARPAVLTSLCMADPFSLPIDFMNREPER